MCQVNPNKTSKENTTILWFNMLKQRMILQRHIKQYQLFITCHSTAKITKHIAKTISSMAWQSIGHSQKTISFYHLSMNFSYSFPIQTKLFENQCMKEGVQPIYSRKLSKPSKQKTKNKNEDAPRTTQLCMKQ